MRRLRNLFLGLSLWLLAILFDHSQRRGKMQSDFEKGFNKGCAWLLIAVMLIFVIRLLSGCQGYTPIIQAELAPRYRGETACDQRNNPVIVENVLYLNDGSLKYTLIHEQTHVLQTKRFGSCKEFLRLYTNFPEVRLRSEVEARCAEYNAIEADGIDVGIEKLVLSLTDSLMTRDSVVKYLTCGGEHGRQWPLQAPP